MTMKSKLLLCLTLVFSCSFATQRAYGYVAEVQINHANLKTDYSFLKIKTKHINLTNNEVVNFIVVVIPKDKDYIYSGTLWINDASIKGSHKTICDTLVQARKLTARTMIDEIPKPLRAKCIVFEFNVAVKYLETSEFWVEESYGEFDAGPTDYCFNLKEFADEK
jgi:hypothetical protein